MSRNANFRLRFLAWLIDRAILCLPFSLLIFWVVQVSDISQLVLRLLVLACYALLPAFQIIYDTLPIYFWGGQFGKLLTGLEIVSENGQRMRFKMLLFRQTIGYMFSTILFGLGYLSIIKDQEHLAWHDKAVGSKVIVKNEGNFLLRKNFWYIGLLSLILLLGLTSYFLVQTVKVFQSNILLKNDLLNLARSYSIEQNNKKTPVSSESAQIGKREINPEYYRVLAEAEMKNKNYNQALDYAQRAVALDPNNSSYHKLLGTILQNLGEKDKAQAEFQKASELNSKLR